MPDPISYIFGGTSGTPTYEELLRRRAVATAQAARQRKMPTTLGEGMTYLGEAVGDRLESNRLTEAERAFGAAGKAEADRIYGSPSPSAAPAVGGVVPYAGLGAGNLPTTRDDLAAALVNRDGAQGVAQMDPTLGAATPPGSPSDEGMWSARQAAIGGIESSDDYDAQGVQTKYGRAQGRYGVMEVNVGPWTQAALGKAMTPAEFRADKNAQDAVFRHRFGQYVARYGEEKAARAWYGGEGNINNLNITDAHEKLSVHDYGQDYLKRLRGKRTTEAGDAASAPFQVAALGGADGTMTDAPPTQLALSKRMPANEKPPLPTYLTPRAPEPPPPPAQPPPPQQRMNLAPSDVENPDQPTVTEDIRPMSVAPNMMAQVGPEMFSPRRMSDALATTGPTARPPIAAPGATVPPPGAAATTAAAPAATAEYIMPKPVPPRPPDRIPETPREIAARRAFIAQPTNPYVKQAAELAIKEEEDKRTYVQQREIARYNGELQHYNALDTKYQEWLAGRAKATRDAEEQQIKITDAREKSMLQARLGGRDPEKFFTEFDKQKQAATTQAHVLGQIAIAKDAIRDGVITGTGAGWRIDAAKLQAWMLNNKVSGTAASNTERMQAALNAMLSVGVQNMQGTDSRVTEGDIAIARGTVAADPKLQLETITRVMGEMERIGREKLNEYEDQRDYYLKGTRAERAYQVPTPPTAPDPRYIDALIKNKDSKADREEFDRRFGAGAAALEIARAKRRER